MASSHQHAWRAWYWPNGWQSPHCIRPQTHTRALQCVARSSSSPRQRREKQLCTGQDSADNIMAWLA
jgi:hypothetical protein